MSEMQIPQDSKYKTIWPVGYSLKVIHLATKSSLKKLYLNSYL